MLNGAAQQMIAWYMIIPSVFSTNIMSSLAIIQENSWAIDGSHNTKYVEELLTSYAHDTSLQ